MEHLVLGTWYDTADSMILFCYSDTQLRVHCRILPFNSLYFDIILKFAEILPKSFNLKLIESKMRYILNSQMTTQRLLLSSGTLGESRGASRAPVASGGRDIMGNWFAHLQKPCSVSPIQFFKESK